LQPTAFGAGMRGASCEQTFWLLERVLPESAAAEPRAVMLLAGLLAVGVGLTVLTVEALRRAQQ